MSTRVVIGRGPDGLRAAAARATAGGPVLLLQLAATPTGRTSPELPEGTGRMDVPAAARARVEAVVGPLVEAPDVRRSILSRGRLLGLPMSKAQVAQIFDGTALPEVGRRWLERRVRNALTPLTGEGREERSYRDWVTRRMGEPVYHHLYADYAASRFGASPDVLSCSVARMVHGADGDGQSGQVAGGGPAQSLDVSISCIEDGGGQVRTDVVVQSLTVEDGRVVAVQTSDGEIVLDGPLWLAVPPAEIAQMLGDSLDSRLHNDARMLETADALQVALKGGPSDLPDEVHIVGESASFYRVVTAYGAQRQAIFHATIPTGQALEPGLPARIAVDADRLGLSGFEEAGARVERLVGHEPVWSARCHARLRRLVLGWEALGIVAVGRQGTFTPMDIGAEVAWALKMSESDSPDQREGLRAMLEPPVRQADLRASVSRFLAR